MLVLDTDVLTIIQRRSGDEYESLAAYLDAADDDVYITIISLEEQMRGWLSAIAKARSVATEVAPYRKLRELLEDFETRPILDFDHAAADQFSRLRREKIRIGSMDLKIAAIVLATHGTLVTKNQRDFKKVPGLLVSPWPAIHS